MVRHEKKMEFGAFGLDLLLRDAKYVDGDDGLDYLT